MKQKVLLKNRIMYSADGIFLIQLLDYLFMLFKRYDNSLMKHLYYGAYILSCWTSEDTYDKCFLIQQSLVGFFFWCA